jgi:methylthioribose-1-phosphate isomerase
MKVKGDHFETIWISKEDPSVVQIIDQRFLPFEFRVEDLRNLNEMVVAIRDMHLRGAPLIGAAGALGMYLALIGSQDDDITEKYLADSAFAIKSTRPTAVNLAWAVDRVTKSVRNTSGKEQMILTARKVCMDIIGEERNNCLHIGQHGVKLIEEISRRKGGLPVKILTHCNAGWLACIDYGTATAPVYLAHDMGIPVEVFVDETRPRNQGAKLTAWELEQHGVPFKLITDNAGGYMMQQGMIDIVIVGSDRASPFGDIVNKVGTYLKALAARDNNIPFYAALPSSTFDWSMNEGASDTPIEERDGDELRYMEGISGEGISGVYIVPPHTPVLNYAFDITPARLVTGIITERGITKADKENILKLYPENNLNPVI